MVTREMLFPDPEASMRIQTEIVEILQQLPFVQIITLGGSILEGRNDCWSDIDVWVECDQVQENQWIAANHLRESKPVLFYRMFKGPNQPSGRYWFSNESVFHKLDISFHSREEFGNLRKHAIQKGYVSRELHSVQNSNFVNTELITLINPLPITEKEQEIGLWMRRTLDRSKGKLRGKLEQQYLEEAIGGLKSVTKDMTKNTVMAGGWLGCLALQILAIGEYVVSN